MKSVNYEAFNKEFFKEIDEPIEWYDRKGLLPLTEDRIAEITLTNGKVAQNYDRYLVEIIHKSSGILSSYEFIFSQHMKERADERHTYRDHFQLVSSIIGKLDWYQAVPTESEINKMATKIKKYVQTYK